MAILLVNLGTGGGSGWPHVDGPRAAHLPEVATSLSELRAETRRARLSREDERARAAVTQRSMHAQTGGSLCIHWFY